MSFSDGIKFLESNGINLFHAFDTPSVSSLICSVLPDFELASFPTTVLIANAGFDFWDSMKQAGVRGSDPVDQYSILLAQEFAGKHLSCKAQILYPSDHPVSLLSFGSRAGWSLATPMGVSIHPTYGTWFAYRALFLIDTYIPASSPLDAEHPCESCIDKPCQTECPSKAVGDMGSFKHETCARFRIEDGSPCADRCLSRLRCPVGSEYRYADEQMKYHYGRSRKTMLRYFGSQTTERSGNPD